MDFSVSSWRSCWYRYIGWYAFTSCISRKVIAPLIKAHKAGLALTTNQLESHYLAGGNVDRVVDANIAAQRADIDLPFERAAAIDLAGRDVLEAVQMSVNPQSH